MVPQQGTTKQTSPPFPQIATKRQVQVAAAVSSQGSSKFEFDPAAGEDSLVDRLKQAGAATVQSIQHASRTQKPPPPYTTAKMQQHAARYLGFSVKQTMSTAQLLFERAALPPPPRPICNPCMLRSIPVSGTARQACTREIDSNPTSDV
jgi:reverse gyrase